MYPNNLQKPIPLRIIFILNALMTFLPFVFYYVITKNEITIEGLNPIWMIYTGIAYIISFSFLVFFFVNRNIRGSRIILLLNILIALPTGAYIAIVIALISLILSYKNDKILNYFNI